MVGLSLFSTSLPKHCCGDFLQTVFIGQLETEGFVGHQTKEQEEVDQPNLGGTNQTLRADNSSIGSSANPGFNGIVYCSKWKFFVACVSFISVTNGFPSRISVLELKPFLTVGHVQISTKPSRRQTQHFLTSFRADVQPANMSDAEMQEEELEVKREAKICCC